MMCMKTSSLCHRLHYVDENKCTCRQQGEIMVKPGRNQAGAVREPPVPGSYAGRGAQEFAARIAGLQEDLTLGLGRLMQRMKNSNFRQLWRLTQALERLRQGGLTHTNKKNAGRSEEVVENTGQHDIMSAQNERFCVQNYRNLRELHDFFAVSHDIFASLRPKHGRVGLRPATGGTRGRMDMRPAILALLYRRIGGST